MTSPQPSSSAPSTGPSIPVEAGERIVQQAESVSIDTPIGEIGDIFISYRIDMDRDLARALEKLVSSSIWPEPRVFVSDQGGLVPSATSLDVQLQNAAAKAKFFVSIITEDSKQRDWIIFEAGAAWGRKVPYAPILVDVGVETIPSPYANYYATPVTSEEKMEVLVREIAKACGARAKSKFARRFEAFQRSVKAHQSHRHGRPMSFEKDDSQNSVLTEAAHEALRSGDTDSADELFAKAADAAPTSEEAASIMEMRLLFGPRLNQRDRRTLLEKWPAKAKQSSRYNIFMSMAEPDLHRALQMIMEARRTVTANSFEEHFALNHHLHLLARLGDVEALATEIRNALTTSGGSLRTALAESFSEIVAGALPIVQLLVMATGYWAKGSFSLCRSLSELAIDQGWPALAAYFTRVLRDDDDSGPTNNQVGRAMAICGLNNEAYKAYEEAIGGNVSVARANAARILGEFPVAAAGLKYFADFKGEWDAAQPSHPYATRAQLEQVTAEENGRRKTIEKVGQAAFHKLTSWLHKFWQPAVSQPLPGTFEDSFDKTVYRFKGSEKDGSNVYEFSVPGAGKGVAKIWSCQPFSNIWAVVTGQNPNLLIAVSPASPLEAIRLNLTSVDTDIVRALFAEVK